MINHRGTETQRKQKDIEFQIADLRFQILLCASVSLWLILIPYLD